MQARQRHHITLEIERKIAVLYRQGLTLMQLRERFGVSKTTVDTVLRRQGVVRGRKSQ